MDTNVPERLINDLTSARWYSLISMIATLILGTFVALLLAYMKRKGERLATKEDFKDILAEEAEKRRAQRDAEFASIRDNLETVRAEAETKKEAEYGAIYKSLEAIRSEAAARKSGELTSIENGLATIRLEAQSKKEAELAAVHQDIENVLREVRLVTKETELIKSKITGDLWDKQTRWNQKKDIYAGLLEITSKMTTTYVKMLDLAQKVRGDKHEIFDTLDDLIAKNPDKPIDRPAEFVILDDELLSAFERLQKTRALLKIFCAPSALIAIDEFVATGPGSTNRTDIRQSLQSITLLEKRLAAVAANDLGLPVQGFPFEDEDELKASFVEILCPNCFRAIRAPKRRPGRNRCRDCSFEFEVAT